MNSSERPTSHNKILQKIIEGNQRWIEGRTQLKPDSQTGKAEELIDFQDPKAVVVTCSDSRVIPELVFDAEIGDLFVIRIAGNIITPEVLASIEFACLELNAELIIILGHQNCGAVAAKLNQTQGNDILSKNMVELIEKIHLSDGTDDYLENIRYNTQKQREFIQERSERLEQLESITDDDIISAVYMMDSRKVEII